LLGFGLISMQMQDSLAAAFVTRLLPSHKTLPLIMGSHLKSRRRADIESACYIVT
jgi:hypothetical protein